MAWRSTTKPTPANIRKRIDSAIEALDAAVVLADKAGITGRGGPIIALANARAWLNDASNKTRKR